jgi:3-hydroxyanthranilate 3,4-dioxygenase
VPIREGEVFLLLAASAPPQRPQEGSVGLVVEAARPHALDGSVVCFECGAQVHRVEVRWSTW